VEEGNTAAWARTRVDGFGARGGRGPGASLFQGAVRQTPHGHVRVRDVDNLGLRVQS
jgi:hypothetical protein